MNRKSQNIRNVISSTMLQIVTIVSGLIIPRLLIRSFGSNVNGLVSSISQLSNYISLLEGGVASVMMANLYKPLYDKNRKKISEVFNTMVHFFHRISMIFVAYQIVLAMVYPFAVDTGYNWNYVFSLTLILGISIFVQYNFSLSARLLLEADNKLYITKSIQTLVVVCNTALTYIGVKVYPNIHVIKAVSALVFTLQPVLYNYYIKKYYNLDKSVKPDLSVLAQRWNGFGINLAAFVHFNTDITILTIFSSLMIVSVYNVHLYVAMGIRQLMLSIIICFVPTLGKRLVENNEQQLRAYFEDYEFFTFYICSVAFSIGASLIVPFIRLYTHGIADTNYHQPIFAILLVTSEWLYCIREPYLELSYQANRFKNIKLYAYFEAAINIILSIAFVRHFGLIGIMIGTICGILYRTIMQVFYSNIILPKAGAYFTKYFVSMLAAGITCNYIIRKLPVYYKDGTYAFLVLTVVTCFITVIFFSVVSLVLYKDKMHVWVNYVLKMMKKS